MGVQICIKVTCVGLHVAIIASLSTIEIMNRLGHPMLHTHTHLVIVI